MTELEWLKQESGLDDAELKAFEAAAGHTKFVAMLQKIILSNENALKDKTAAETARLDFEKRYNDEFIPEMRKVTTDALAAQGEAARLKAQLDKAREYGIVPEPEPVKAPVEPPRAPGSDPSLDDRFNRFSSAQSSTLIALNDLNAEHFRLKGEPLGNTQELVDEVQRQRTLGHKNFSLKQAWEAKYDVPKLREDIAAKALQKTVDEKVAAALKTEREKSGANPNLRSGQPSKYSTYKQSDSTKEPWKAPRSKTQANKSWRDNAISKVSEFAA